MPKFDAEVGKVLHLMIHSLYSNKDIFLRELISNASDACDKLRYAAIEDPSLLEEDTELKISVIVNLQDKTIEVKDNGIGMNEEELKENLGTIASSGTQRFLEQMEKSKGDTNLIGQFGVGFYSSFMVADEVVVLSQKAGTNNCYKWKSDGQEEYSIEKEASAKERGVSILLKIKEEEMKFLDHFAIEHIIKTYSDHIAFPIELITIGEKEEDNKNAIVNSASALWRREKKDITEEQYNELYKHISHMPDKPWMVLHHKIEGNVEYRSLLYVPSSKPFDLFHPDRKTCVKLYIKQVFITENLDEIIPRHLRFLRGIIDSEDLQLNVSRESLQHNPVMHKIKKSMISKVLSELKKKSEEDELTYSSFWSNFGEVIKEGLCEFGEDKEKILDICRFYTLNSGEQTISLQKYIDSMLPNQKQIFFVTGDKRHILSHSPHLEGFRQRGIDVLLLEDHVDDFWTNVTHEYKDKKLLSVTDEDINLDDIKELEEGEKEEKLDEKTLEENKGLTNFTEGALQGLVKEVKISNKLVDSPACLKLAHGSMSIRMERYLRDQNQLATPVPRILELNPKHALVEKVKKELDTATDHTLAKELVDIIYDQACVLAGEELRNAPDFIKRLNDMIQLT